MKDESEKKWNLDRLRELLQERAELPTEAGNLPRSEAGEGISCYTPELTPPEPAPADVSSRPASLEGVSFPELLRMEADGELSPAEKKWWDMKRFKAANWPNKFREW